MQKVLGISAGFSSTDETFLKTKFSPENQLCGFQGEDSQHMTLR
jgi:hypothetical protein